MKKIVIIGATSAIAEQCARIYLREDAVELLLVGRDEKKLDAIADDLRVRQPQALISIALTDFIDAQNIQSFVQAVCDKKTPDTVLIAHGSLPIQEDCQNHLPSCDEAIKVTGLSVVLFCEAFAHYLYKANSGRLIVLGSVAGDRGRKSNYIYGAAKGMVERYVEGVQHRFANDNKSATITLIKPGPTATPMTDGLNMSGLASPEQVASDIVRGSNSGKAVVYTPIKWALIMFVIRNLPRFIYNKMGI